MPRTVAQALTGLHPLNRGNPNPIIPVTIETQFKKGNYWGYPSREAWSEAFKARKAERKKRMSEERRREKVKKEAKNIQDVAREYSEAAMRTLVEIMNNDQEVGSVRIQAANTIIERGYGKPVTPTVNLNTNVDAKPEQINGTDLDLEVARTIREVRKLTNGKTEEGESTQRPPDLCKYN